MKVIVNKNISKPKYVLIFVFAFILGLLILYVGIEGLIKTDILNSWEKAEATVISSHIKHSSNSGNGTLYVDYTYNVKEKEYSGHEQLWWKRNSFDLRANDKIDIYYKIESPEKSKVYHISFFMILLSVPFFILTPLMLKERLKTDKITKEINKLYENYGKF